MYDLLVGDCLESISTLAPNSIHSTITSPPYLGLRDYLAQGQVGRESTLSDYVSRLVTIFREVRRVLRDDGTLWLNLGDAYAQNDREKRGHGIKRGDLKGLPWRVAFALQEDGWHLRRDIIWHKPNATPESVKDRPSGSHEYLFLLTKSRRYFYDREAVREPNQSLRPDKRADRGKWADNPEAHGGFSSWNPRGRGRRSVWTLPTSCFLPARIGIPDVTHYAAFPERLVEPCILAGTSQFCCEACGKPYRRQVISVDLPLDADVWEPRCDCNAGAAPGVVLDPFAGTGTTGATAIRLGRRAVLCELNPDYARLADARCAHVLQSCAHAQKAVGAERVGGGR